METKINIILLIIAITIFGCNNENNKLDVEIEKRDTIYFASENNIHQYQSAFLVEGAIGEQNYVTFKSYGKGSEVWIDSILYEKKGIKSFFSIIREPTRGYYVLYYNGDSLLNQIVTKWNCPKIDTNTFNKGFTRITIRDSMYSFGYLNYINFKYILSDSCILLKEESSFPKIPINHE